MEHDTPRLTLSYALLDSRESINRIAENPPEYQADSSDSKHTGGSKSPATAEPVDPAGQPDVAERCQPAEPVVATEPTRLAESERPDHRESASTLPPGLVSRGQTLRLATALVEGASVACADRRANADRLLAFTRLASGKGTSESLGKGTSESLGKSSDKSSGKSSGMGSDTRSDLCSSQTEGEATESTSATDTCSRSRSSHELVDRLSQLVRSNDRNLAEQLTLLVQIDELRLWDRDGYRDCAHWLDRSLGISRITALERLRVARALQSLPLIESLFALGKLSWSKVRELTRVADPACEQELTAAALELSASETVDLCQRWHHTDIDSDDSDDSEAARALQAFQKRSLTWRQRDACTTRITLDLPHHLAAEFLKALEAHEDMLRESESDAKCDKDCTRDCNPDHGADHDADQNPDCDSERGPDRNSDRNLDSDTDSNPNRVPERGSDSAPIPESKPDPIQLTSRQLRADAAVAMSACALAHLGEPIASADRYRVLVNIDARVLAGNQIADAGCGTATPPGELPPERPCIAGYGPIAAATARRLASQARLTVVATDEEGEVVATGRDTRLFSPSSIRAITARDRCCQMPGCTRTRWLQAHHVVPWSEGGATTISNGCLICSACHTRLHEGGLRLERVAKASIALSDDVLDNDQTTMTSDEQSRARAAIAAVQRFRLVGRDGQFIAGPRRRAGCTDRTAHSERTACTDCTSRSERDECSECSECSESASSNLRGNDCWPLRADGLADSLADALERAH